MLFSKLMVQWILKLTNEIIKTKNLQGGPWGFFQKSIPCFLHSRSTFLLQSCFAYSAPAIGIIINIANIMMPSCKLVGILPIRINMITVAMNATISIPRLISYLLLIVFLDRPQRNGFSLKSFLHNFLYCFLKERK